MYNELMYEKYHVLQISMAEAETIKYALKLSLLGTHIDAAARGAMDGRIERAKDIVASPYEAALRFINLFARTDALSLQMETEGVSKSIFCITPQELEALEISIKYLSDPIFKDREHEGGAARLMALSIQEPLLEKIDVAKKYQYTLEEIDKMMSIVRGEDQ